MKRSLRVRAPVLALAAALAPVFAGAADELSRLGLEDLMEYTVVGASKYAQRPAAVAAAVSVITRDEIRTFGWRTLGEALASLPGTHLSYDRQFAGMGARGFSVAGDFNARLLITINGNRANSLVYDSLTVDRSFPVDLSLVERIEFIPGPGGAVYGQNALFGVVNVVTRSGASFDGGEVAFAYQDPQRGRDARASWGKLLDNGVDVLLSATASRADGENRHYRYPGADRVFPGFAPGEGVARGMDGERDQDLLVRVAGGPWSFDFIHGKRRKEDPTASYYTVPLRGEQYQTNAYSLAQLQYQNSFAGETLHFTARAFAGRARYKNRLQYSVPAITTGDSDWQGVELRLLSTALASHKLMVGFEYQNNSRIDQFSKELGPPYVRLAIPGSGWRAGLYVQDEWTLSERLTATLGVRADDNNVLGSALSPRLGLIWKASAASTVKALYGRAHRAPNAYERDYGNGQTHADNPALTGETVDTVELVLDRQLAPDTSVRASLYRWKLKNLIVQSPNPELGLLQFRSGSDVIADGVELSVRHSWRWGGRLRGSLTYQDAASESGFPRNSAPKWLGKLDFSAPLFGTGVRMGAELHYVGRRVAPGGHEMGAYWLSNVHFRTLTWAKGLTLSAGIHNLFDERYEHPLAVNWAPAVEQDGRSVRLMATYSF